MTLKNEVKNIKRTIEKIFFHKDFTSISDIKNYQIEISKNPRPRLNLLITSMNSQDVYAGIKSAVDFFMKFKKFDIDLRIIVMGKKIDESSLYQVPSFEFIKDYSIENDSESRIICDLSKNCSLLFVRERDYFLSTMWYTAYNANNVLDEQKRIFGKRMPMVYLVQDYEPGFYPWSSEYLLAESTYHLDNQLVVFNSKYLKEFFDANGYRFENSYYFDPVLNEKLGEILNSADISNIERKNRILFYGRPSKARNAFQLICMALEKWSVLDKHSSNWEIFSAGEDLKDIKLNNNIVIKSLGKMSVEEYAKFMLESKIGISLMASPHPSYPPLEMATFGMKVITNSFVTKDISDFNENIISIEHININKLAEELHFLTTSDIEYKISKNDDYINGISQLDTIVDEIGGHLQFQHSEV